MKLGGQTKLTENEGKTLAFTPELIAGMNRSLMNEKYTPSVNENGDNH